MRWQEKLVDCAVVRTTVSAVVRSQRQPLRIALIGERRDDVPAHRAIELALPMAARAEDVDVSWTWWRTDALGADVAATLACHDGLWCVPASPYASMEGALAAIRWARESGRPFLGTCGGFQHAIIEYARNVLNLTDADHAETAPEAANAVISLLACSLVEATASIRLISGTRIHAAYGADEIVERYRCRYGLDPRYADRFDDGEMRITARDTGGEVRAVELRSHPFFVATLFQHERRTFSGELPPLVRAFISAATG